jgi:hypothetical protein
MLFDLEDYMYSGVIGTDWENIIDLQDNGVSILDAPWGSTPNQPITVYGGNMADWNTVERATRDAWFKDFNEYIIAAIVSNVDKKVEFDALYIEFCDAKIDYFNASRDFWKAMVSIKFLNGRNGGEEAFNEVDPYAYSPGLTVMTQEIYDDYYSKLKVCLALSKQLVELSEGFTFDY